LKPLPASGLIWAYATIATAGFAAIGAHAFAIINWVATSIADRFRFLRIQYLFTTIFLDAYKIKFSARLNISLGIHVANAFIFRLR